MSNITAAFIQPCRKSRVSLACGSHGRPKSKKHTKRKGVTKTGKPYEMGLDRTLANFQPLTPLHFVERAAKTFPKHTAIIHGPQRTDYVTFYARSRRLASALARKGIKKGDTVAVILANAPPMLEAHYGVPMLGAVLNALNTRLDAAALAFMLEHGGAKILITDREFSATVAAALTLLKKKPLVIDYDDKEFPQSGVRLGKIDYEKFLKPGDPDFAWRMPDDEWDAIAKHPAVLFVAVVARPDAKWGEYPCAFVELRPGARVSETEISDFARARLAKFKMPRTIVFSDLPKTSTGKIQKFLLREMAKAL